MRKKKDSFMTTIRNEVLKSKKERIIYSFLIILFLFSSVYLTWVIFIQHVYPTGYSTYLDSKAGYITYINLTYKKQTFSWGGIYGLALRVPDFMEQIYRDIPGGSIERVDLFFDCIQHDLPDGPLIFAATSPTLNFDNIENIQPATHEMINDFMECPEDAVVCSEDTFVLQKNFTIGEEIIENVLYTYTYKYDGNNEVFDIGALNISGELVFVSHVSTEFQSGYDPDLTINYQMILPMPEGTTVRYYFFSNPYDFCPQGGVGVTLLATAYGYVRDIYGNPLENASINVAGYPTESDLEGFYNLSFLVVPGEYHLVSSKPGYGLFVDTIGVNFTNYLIEKNITLPPETEGESIQPQVYGWVSDGGGTPLSSVIVYLGDSSTVSNSEGYYSMTPTVIVGENPLVAFKQNYDNYYHLLDFNSSVTFLEHNITMEVANPFLTGPYTEIPIEKEILIEGKDYMILPDEIKKQIRQNTFIRDSLKIYNFRSDPMRLFFYLSGDAANLMRLSENFLEISSNNSQLLEYAIYATEPLGVYTGTLEISGNLNVTIPIRIEIVDRRLNIETLLVELNLLKDVIQPNEELRFRVNLQNLLTDQSYKVSLTYRILDSNNTEVYASDSEEVELISSVTLLKSLIFENPLPEGDYILVTDARYSNLFSTAIAPFKVVKPFYLNTFFGIPLWTILVGVVFLSFVSLNLFAYKLHMDKKKRYKISRDFSSLPKEGERALKIGKIAETNVDAYYNMDDLTTHMVVAGATGGGKSISAQVFVEEALKKNIAVVV
ncbi:DUF87 domain-containing protein, partial [Patescibacteria group bacterium]|nr:DUF87 domain-containing protein [Patescibacteria group bacterium]